MGDQKGVLPASDPATRHHPAHCLPFVEQVVFVAAARSGLTGGVPLDASIPRRLARHFLCMHFDAPDAAAVRAIFQEPLAMHWLAAARAEPSQYEVRRLLPPGPGPQPHLKK